MKRLSSRHHPIVASCRALARGQRNDRLLLDGLRLVEDARRAGIRIETAACTERVLASPDGARLVSALSADGAEVVGVTDALMEALSPVSTPSGIVAIGARPPLAAARVFDRTPQAVVIALDIQDPGNVGAILRAAEAGGATGAVFCGASADPFGWKALRGSMGSALRVPLQHGVTLTEALDGARRAGIRLVAALPRGGRRPDEADLRLPVAFLLGGEGAGLPRDIVAAADDCVSIPMTPPVESLNVAVAAALLVYEAARQRRDAPS